MRQYVHVSATLDKELSKKVNEFCAREERSRSWLIEKAVKQLLEEMEDLEIAYQRIIVPETKIISSKELRKRLNV